ncbi:MAG: glycerate kinase [Myxococcaceae bacterium]
MRILIAPQEFKKTLTSSEAAEAIARGLRSVREDFALELCPLADGGPGTVDAALTVAGAEERLSAVRDPLGRQVRARWALMPERAAVLEMAAASGLALLAPSEYAPRIASTRGTGELLSSALAEGCTRTVLGAGGSATNDAGAGALQELGVRLLDAEGKGIAPGGAALRKLHAIDLSHSQWRGELIVVTDVSNPLLGSQGATAVFGPQKGASAEDVQVLEEALGHFAEVVKRELGRDVAATPRTGAAGGLAYGLHAVLEAELHSGFEAVSALIGLERRIGQADLVITGEGRLDAQTAFGKGPAQIARVAARLGKRVVAIVGAADSDADRGIFAEVIETSPGERPERSTAIVLLERAAAELGLRLVR